MPVHSQHLGLQVISVAMGSNMEKAFISVESINLNFRGMTALADVSIEVDKGEFIAIIGPNGAGKTSLLNCLSGFYRPQTGNIFLDGHLINKLSPHKICELGMGRTFQQVELYTGATVLDNILAGRHPLMKSGLLLSTLYIGPAQREDVRHRRVVEEIIDFLELEAVRKHLVGTLPYGIRKRVELGKALAVEPRILILDEPVAGMNVEEKEDMARFLLDIYDAKGLTFIKQRPTIILVEHDMGLVMDLVDRIIVLDWGRKIADGPPHEIRTNQKVIASYLGEVS